MTGARILVVDDEPAIVDAVSYALRGEGYEVEARGTGEEALDATQAGSFDLVLLDLMLPGVSGLEVCRRLRETSDVPILMLTARDAEVDRVVGLDSGADDYVTKPFSVAELQSRVRALLRRRELDRGSGASTIRAGDLTLDLARHEVEVDGRREALTPSELKLLGMLAREPGRVFTRRELQQHLWSSDFVADERAVDTHVANLRRKIERERAKPQRLLSVRGVGYKLANV